ncbi:cysteine dioxygenase [Aggregicoccus sp. 17bor-14]|uniref:cysteine dioxygenase n=1 Tax=Myxococcaceae TaxID=31 RepID=UPI00129C518D|nr:MULTISPECIES: cysteine dioxygenase family protein [Myxococcaceae]MBF5045431.1 cysteine dioxygenase family protein [Simulacricoccus sp. 17bor-14]MRI91172.1 cysteine dioxygenase [Aggregicoccus sp. 17bor-14]
MTLEALLARLRDRLQPSSPDAGTVAVSAPELDSELAGVRIEVESLGPYLFFRPGHYTRNLVYRDDAFELVLNCWDAGAVSPVHEHAGQECWFSIQAGAFLLENFPLLAGGRVPGHARLGPPECVGPVGVGHVDHRTPSASVHRVRALDGPAVSLHVYARPIDSCLVFDLARQRCHLRQLRYDSVFGRVVRPLPERPQGVDARH